MFSSIRSRVIAAGVAAVVIGAGSYGIVAANASSASPAASSSTPGTHASARAGARIRRPGIQRPVRAGRRGHGRHCQQRDLRGLHGGDPDGREGDRHGGVFHHLREGDEPGHGQRRHYRRARPGAGHHRQHDHHGHPGHRAAARHQRIEPGRTGDPLQQGPAGFHRAGRPDPGGLHPGVGDDRQRNGRGPRRPKRHWPPTPAASSTASWPSATASTRSTTSASTGPTTSSSTRTSRSSAPTTSRHGQAAADQHRMKTASAGNGHGRYPRCGMAPPDWLPRPSYLR